MIITRPHCDGNSQECSVCPSVSSTGGDLKTRCNKALKRWRTLANLQVWAHSFCVLVFERNRGWRGTLGLIRWFLTDYTHRIQNMSCSCRILTLTFHADVRTFSPRSMENSFISKVSSWSGSLWEVLWNVPFPVLFTDTLHHQPARTNCI